MIPLPNMRIRNRCVVPHLIAPLMVATILVGCQSPNIHRSDARQDPHIDHETSPKINAIAKSRGWGELVQQPLLDDWIQAALSNASQQKVADATVRLAAAQVRSAAAQRSPSLHADFTIRGGQKQNAMTQYQTEDLEPFAFGLYGTWNLDVFRTIQAQVDVAEAANTVVQLEREQTQLNLAATIATHYLEGVFLRQQRHIRQQMLASQETIIHYLRSRAAQGLAPAARLDDAQAQASDMTLALSRISQRLEENNMMWDYLVQTNMTPAFKDSSPTLPETLPPVPPKQNLHTTTLQRPDIRAAYAMVEGANHQLTASKRSRLPELSIMSQLEAETPSPVEEPEEWLAWAGVRLSLPILSPDRGAATNLSEARLQQQNAILDDTMQLALLDLRETYAKRQHAESQWQAASQRLTRVQKQFESIQRKFQEGLISVLTREQARIQWYTAQEQERRQLTTTLQQHIALIRAHGGPDTEAPPLPTTSTRFGLR